MPDFEAVAYGKLSEVLGQLIRLRNCGAVQQNRDYGDITLQSRCNFDAHEIMRVIQAAVSCLIVGIKPIQPR